ncbi:MAG: hypothetical protein GWM98_30030, partial [Nitrospinaceae bacterium]|nr:hypothetical protein [Nitrospinaceae bacterium]
KRFKPWAVVWAVSGGLVLFSGQALAVTFDQIVAKVNKEIITESELEERTNFELSNLMKRNVQPLPSKAFLKHKILDRMIEEKLLLEAARKLDLKVNDESVLKAIADIEKNAGLRPGQLEGILKAENKSMEEYRNDIRNQILMSKVMSYEVHGKIKVGEKEAIAYYEEHLKEFWRPEKIKARHILFILDKSLALEDIALKESKAARALKKIRQGQKFEEVAREYSEDISANSGGDLGEIERGKMVPEFEKAAFQLKEGEVSGIVKSPYGLHIIKVDKFIPGGTVPFEEVRAQIQRKLQSEKGKTEYEAYLTELRQNAFIEKRLPPLPEPKARLAEKVAPNWVPPHQPQDGKKAQVPSRSVPEGAPLSDGNPFARFQPVEEQLRHYKRLKDSDQISEEEYQQKKQKLLDSL